MRSKSTLYSQEARELVRNISIYSGFSPAQLYRFRSKNGELLPERSK